MSSWRNQTDVLNLFTCSFSKKYRNFLSQRSGNKLQCSTHLKSGARFSTKAEFVLVVRNITLGLTHPEPKGTLTADTKRVSLGGAAGKSSSTHNTEKMENRHEHQAETHTKNIPIEQIATLPRFCFAMFARFRDTVVCVYDFLHKFPSRKKLTSSITSTNFQRLR